MAATPTPGAQATDRHRLASAPTRLADKPAPRAATTNVTAGAPPTLASASSGPSVCPKASRPQGNPPKGTRARSASVVVHAHAIHSGAPGRRCRAAARIPNRANAVASSADNASQGIGPT